MKTPFIFLFTFNCLFLFSQLNVSVMNGSVINADPGTLKPGIGPEITGLIPVNQYMQFSGMNYVTLSANIMTYPHSDQPYKYMLNDGIDNSYNYIKIMSGFRIPIRLQSYYGDYNHYRGYRDVDGLSFEPRIGFMVFDLRNNDNHNHTWCLSSQFNYTLKHIQLSVYGLYSKSRRHTNIGYLQMFTLGSSLGITF